MRIRNGFEEFFCVRSNLGNCEIISAQRPGLKTGVENDTFWSEIGSVENRAAHPHQDFPGLIPPPPLGVSIALLMIKTCSVYILVAPYVSVIYRKTSNKPPHPFSEDRALRDMRLSMGLITVNRQTA